jgi:hypothetical protein
VPYTIVAALPVKVFTLPTFVNVSHVTATPISSDNTTTILPTEPVSPQGIDTVLAAPTTPTVNVHTHVNRDTLWRIVTLRNLVDKYEVHPAKVLWQAAGIVLLSFWAALLIWLFRRVSCLPFPASWALVPGSQC